MTAATITSTSPHRPDTVLGRWADIGPGGVDAAVDRATRSAAAWRRTTAFERGVALRFAAERMEADATALSDLIVLEVGKPVREARAEVARAVAILRFYAGVALDADGMTYPAPDGRSWLLTRRRPRGVVALITPWNFPVAIPIWKAAPALAYGNVVLLKPASSAMACAHRVASYFELPDGVFEVLSTGPGGACRLAAREGVHALSFTGSAPVGRELAEATAGHGIAFQGEMGGSNASIILPDADIGASVAMIAPAAMAFAGQKCTATSRVIVVGDAAGARDGLVAAIAALPVGDPAREETVVGPMISSTARDAVLDGMREAVARGGTVLLGAPATGPGSFQPPVLIELPDAHASMAREEYFGPLCAVFSVPDLAAAIDLANDTPYGLVTSVFTNDLSRVLGVTDQLEAGLIRINAPTTGVDFHVPFGGDKASSSGPREQGRAAREFYTSTATITVAPDRP